MVKVLEVGHKRYCRVEGEYFMKSIVPSEYPGFKMVSKWPAQRVANEITALKLVEEQTNILVPKAFESGFDDELGYWVKLEWVAGIELGNFVDRGGAGEACLMTPGRDGHADSGRCEQCRTVAMANAELFVHEVVHPELEKLQSHKPGLNGTVIPPPWIFEDDEREHWPVKTSDGTGAATPFVLCHGDLAYHNILLDPVTLKVKWLLDWEYAGFFPKYYLKIFSTTVGARA